MNRASRSSLLIKIAMILFFVGCLLYPILQVLCSITPESLQKITASAQFQRALGNSLKTAIPAMLIAVILACAAAWATLRTDMWVKGIFAVLFTVPMLIPSYSHASGLILVFGQNGILTNWLRLDKLFGNSAYIYGYWGIVLGSVMFSFPVAFIMISDIMKYQDCTPYEAADVLGIPRLHQFFSVTWPYYRKPMISVIFVVFTSIITDYGVPHIIGGQYKTVAALMYTNTVKLLNFEKGGVYGAVLLIPAVIAFVMDFANKDKGNLAFIGKQFEIKVNKARDVIAFCISLLMTVYLMLPIFCAAYRSMVVSYPVDMRFSLSHYSTVAFKSGFMYLRNSLLIAVVVSLIGVVFVYIDAYLTVRMRSTSSRVLHLLTMTTMAVPGIVLGLSYVIVFKKTVIYNTFWILFLVNMVHMFASPYLMMYNSFGKLNENLEDVGTTLGIDRFHMIVDVIVPLTKSTMWDAMSYFFVQCMKTITAVAFLWTSYTKPLALKIDEYNANVEFENVAVVTILILTINALYKVIANRRQHILARNRNRLGNVSI